MSSTDGRATRALALALSVLGTGCVVTTFEGQGDPPRVAVPPPPPGHKHGSSGGDPSSGETFAEAPARAEDRIGARHILVMYSGSKRAPAGVTRSREEALQRAEQARTRALAGEDFAALVDATVLAPYDIGWRKDVSVVLTGSGSRVRVNFRIAPI